MDEGPPRVGAPQGWGPEGWGPQTPKGWGPETVSWGRERCRGPKISRSFFFPPVDFFVLFSLSWGSSRGIWWCFRSRRGFTVGQPKNSKRAHLRVWWTVVRKILGRSGKRGETHKTQTHNPTHTYKLMSFVVPNSVFFFCPDLSFLFVPNVCLFCLVCVFFLSRGFFSVPLPP